MHTYQQLRHIKYKVVQLLWRLEATEVLGNVYLPELLEHVSVSKVREAAGTLSICVFSFVMAYNNKKVGAICGCHITFCVQTQDLWFFKFPIFQVFGFIQINLMCLSNELFL